MILDPTLPDLTPKLPVWLMAIDGGATGWTAGGWPAIKRGGAWALNATGWRPLDDHKESMITKMPRPAVPAIAPIDPRIHRTTTTISPTTSASSATASTASTAPTSSPSSASSALAPATQPTAPPILVDRDGRRWFDGRQSLHVVEPGGKTIDWPLPPTAAGDDAFEPVLLRTTGGLLFLFNQPGRVVRIKPTPDAPEPFAVEAVFTHRIPSSDAIRRIWLDPAGRIVIAYEANRLAILFPTGRIPRVIETMIPANEMDDQP